ncbi:UNKNOWN [Stylonychia lemnae]|uniref:SH3b domain-containing protein n=1 Tax=Stylonychia lemnae TaxID=5949 RepID=A0A078AKW8_STYLE|nr:UNKNOWN [Stylonychia lemnae]|eukprot:CDW83015.1 UNKNOWN [Stylonychia lemnae]
MILKEYCKNQRIEKLSWRKQSEMGNMRILFKNNKDKLSYKFVKKHCVDKKSFKDLEEIFIYELDEPLSILSKILSLPSTLNSLMKVDNKVIGIAYSPHNAAGHCIVVIMTDKIKVLIFAFVKYMFQENLQKVMIVQKAVQQRDLTALQSQCIKQPEQSPNVFQKSQISIIQEIEDKGLEQIASYMIFGRSQRLKSFELVDLIQQRDQEGQIDCQQFKDFMMKNQVITSEYIINQVIERLKQKKQPKKLLAKKFDQVIRPYINRFLKHDEIKITLMNVKKRIFEMEFTLSNFFVLCQINNSQELSLNRNYSTNQSQRRLVSPSVKTFNTTETNQRYREYIKIDQLFKGLYSIGYQIPLGEFNQMIAAFRVTKGKFLDREDFLRTMNQIIINAVIPKKQQNVDQIGDYLNSQNGISNLRQTKTAEGKGNDENEGNRSVVITPFKYNQSNSNLSNNGKQSAIMIGDYDDTLLNNINGNLSLQQLIQKKTRQSNTGRPQTAIKKGESKTSNEIKQDQYLSENKTKLSTKTNRHDHISEINYGFMDMSSPFQHGNITPLIFSPKQYKSPNAINNITQTKRPSSSYTTANKHEYMIQKFLEDSSSNIENVYIPQEFSHESPKSPSPQKNNFLLRSPSKQLDKAKKYISQLQGFKLDPQFKGPSQARCLGCNVFNGPGNNHDKLGRLEKDGVVNVLNRTIDQTWVQVKNANMIGWILASNIDFIPDRNVYKSFDKSYAQNKQKNEITTSMQNIMIRQEPKWGSKALIQLLANTPLKVKGWVPTEQLNINLRNSYKSEKRKTSQTISDYSETTFMNNSFFKPQGVDFLDSNMNHSFTNDGKMSDHSYFGVYDSKNAAGPYDKHQIDKLKSKELKEQASYKLMELRIQALCVDKQEKRKQELLWKFVQRFAKWPLVKGFKHWQYQTQVVKQRWKEFRHDVRSKYYEPRKLVTENIAKLKHNIIISNKESQIEYKSRQKFEQDMIKKTENELQIMKNIRVARMKERQEFKIAENKYLREKYKTIKTNRLRIDQV